MTRSGIATIAAAAAVLAIGGPAQAAIQTFDFHGHLNGTPAGFPPYLTPLDGSISYDPANSGFPYNGAPDADYGISSWSYHAITAFNFTAGSLNGAYAGPGAGTFVVFNDNGGLDALAPTIFTVPDGLTGDAPAGYHLVSAGLYFYSNGRLLGGSSALPDPISDVNLGAFTGKLFSATYALDSAPDSPFTIYGTITSVPEPASWALMLVGVGALGGMLRLNRRRPAVA